MIWCGTLFVIFKFIFVVVCHFTQMNLMIVYVSLNCYHSIGKFNEKKKKKKKKKKKTTLADCLQK